MLDIVGYYIEVIDDQNGPCLIVPQLFICSGTRVLVLQAAALLITIKYNLIFCFPIPHTQFNESFSYIGTDISVLHAGYCDDYTELNICHRYLGYLLLLNRNIP